MARTSRKKNNTRSNRNNNSQRNAVLENMPVACTNLIGNDLYGKLLKEKKLARFIGLIKVCSSTGKDMATTVEMIKKSFPCYITNNDFNVMAFVDMMKNHYEVAEAWGYGVAGDMINKQLVADAALELALKAKNIEVIEQYNKMYNKENSGEDLEEDTVTDNKTVFNFNVST